MPLPLSASTTCPVISPVPCAGELCAARSLAGLAVMASTTIAPARAGPFNVVFRSTTGEYSYFPISPRSSSHGSVVFRKSCGLASVHFGTSPSLRIQDDREYQRGGDGSQDRRQPRRDHRQRPSEDRVGKEAEGPCQHGGQRRGRQCRKQGPEPACRYAERPISRFA